MKIELTLKDFKTQIVNGTATHQSVENFRVDENVVEFSAVNGGQTYSHLIARDCVEKVEIVL